MERTTQRYQYGDSLIGTVIRKKQNGSGVYVKIDDDMDTVVYLRGDALLGSTVMVSVDRYQPAHVRNLFCSLDSEMNSSEWGIYAYEEEERLSA